MTTAEHELGGPRGRRGRGPASGRGGVSVNREGRASAGAGERGGGAAGQRIALLTKRRAVDYCRVATALCPSFGA